MSNSAIGVIKNADWSLSTGWLRARILRGCEEI
jgi:hypothetical protein